MGRLFPLLCLLLATVAGCNRGTQAETVPAEQGGGVPQAAANGIADGKAELQDDVESLIERTLGGDQAAKKKLLGTKSVSITRVDDIKLVSVVPKYGSSGEPVPGWYQIRLQVQGYDGVGTRFDKGDFDRVLTFTAAANKDDESGWFISYDGSPSD